jgi:hypothetical protein
MVHKYISDRELGSVERSSEEINADVWNGIVSVYESTVVNNVLSGSFPEECPDGQVICGCDRSQLENAIKAEIPRLPTPIRGRQKKEFYLEEDIVPEKYAILDFIEFLHRNIKDPVSIGRYHGFYSHRHYRFTDSGQAASEYRNKINTIFARSGIVFYLDEDGLIKRTVPESLKRIITDIRFSTNDPRLNELLKISYSKFILPKTESRIESLEKIWDAFERIKTYYKENKKISASTLIVAVSDGNSLFQSQIEEEFGSLTNVGNKFQIRHFERGKVQLHSNLHIDYLFYRMSSLIHLCVESIKMANRIRASN